MVGKRDGYKGIKHSLQMAKIFARKSGAHKVKVKYHRAKEEREWKEEEIHLLVNQLEGEENDNAEDS